MSVSCFTSTNSHLCKFLRTTGRDWRNTIYIECGDCQRAVSRGCKNLLCAFDTAGAPVIVPVHDVEYLFSTTVDKSECRAILTKANFCELYKGWIDEHIHYVQLGSFYQICTRILDKLCVVPVFSINLSNDVSCFVCKKTVVCFRAHIQSDGLPCGCF